MTMERRDRTVHGHTYTGRIIHSGKDRQAYLGEAQAMDHRSPKQCRGEDTKSDGKSRRSESNVSKDRFGSRPENPWSLQESNGGVCV